MTINIDVPIENIGEVMAADPSPAYTHWRLYSSTSPASGFTQVGADQPLIAEQELYAFEDAAGTQNTWYKMALWSGAVESSHSLPWQSHAYDLHDLALDAAKFAGRGFDSQTTADGTAAGGLIDDELDDEGESVSYLEGSWIHLPAAAVADQQRRVATDGFTPGSATLKPSRPWSADGVVAQGVNYQVFQLLPIHTAAGQPYSWKDAVRDAMKGLKYEDQLNLGEGSSARKNHFSLGPWMDWIKKGYVTDVYLRETDSNGVHTWRDASKQGRYFEWRTDGVNDLGFDIFPAPLETQTVIVMAQRPYADVYGDDDVIPANDRRVLIRATVVEVYRHMNRVHGNRMAGEQAAAQHELDEQYENPLMTVRGG